MVYAIFSGYYSDWDVHGYFTNPDDAYAFCEFHNKGKDRYNKYCVRPIEEMSIDFTERPNFHYKFIFYAFVQDGTVGEVFLNEVCTAPGGMCPNDCIEGYKMHGFDYESKKTINYRYSVEIFMKEYDYERAYKIASDMIHKKVAEDLRL